MIGHARYTKNGCGYDPLTFRTYPKGTNVMYQRVFWDIDYEAAKRVAEEHGANLVWEPVTIETS